MIDEVHKSVSKIRLSVAPSLGVKSVHVFWLYELLNHPQGMTAAEIAAARSIDRSLVSREIALLKKAGYVRSDEDGRKRGYNARITLTDEGTALANRITEVAMSVQTEAGGDISEEELAVFYSVLSRLGENLGRICDEIGDKGAPV